MTGGSLPPEQFAEAAAAWGDEFFAIRVAQENDADRLRAVIECEIERREDTRKDRIARVNKRLEILKTQ